jgi:uncharacterized protein
MKILLPLLVIVFIIAFLLGGLFSGETVYVEKTETKPVYLPQISAEGDAFTSTILVPAVDENNHGVITTIQVQAREGSGQILTNIDKILFWVDTQNSIITARNVAANVTGIDPSNYDLTYTITANASVIEGPSAGAALTIATISALENIQLNPGVMITGTIEASGRVGPVGKVLEKANAASDYGADLFIIPEGYELKTFGYERVKECQTAGGIESCQVKYVKKEMNGGDGIGITIKEVNNINEALEYFLER